MNAKRLIPLSGIVAVVLVMLISAGLAYYAIFGEPTGRIGRSREFVAVFSVLGVLWTGWTAVKGIRSRRP